jgi:hypothetical protein
MEVSEGRTCKLETRESVRDDAGNLGHHHGEGDDLSCLVDRVMKPHTPRNKGSAVFRKHLVVEISCGSGEDQGDIVWRRLWTCG